MEQLEFIDSKFRLAILAAKRAKQLVSGAKKRIDTVSDNPLNIALEEITQGQINFQVIEDFEREAAEREAMASLSDDQDVSFLLNTGDDSSPLNFNDDDDEDDESDEDESDEEEVEEEVEEKQDDDADEVDDVDADDVDADEDVDQDIDDEIDEDDDYDNDDFEVGEDDEDDD